MLHGAASAGAASAWICLVAAGAGAGIAGAAAFWASIAACLAAIRSAGRPPAAFWDSSAGLEPEVVTPMLVQLRSPGWAGQALALWCDAVPPDAFRRLAAAGRWRRVVGTGGPPRKAGELIGDGAVTGMQGNGTMTKGPRSGWPRPQ